MKPGLLQKVSFAVLISLTALAASFAPALAAGAPPDQQPAATLPALDRFAATVANGQVGVVRGVYVPGVLALRVVQQPGGSPGYVSAMAGVATQFQYAANAGVTGLLGHNYSSGASFFQLAPGQEVAVVYGDGGVRRYLVTAVYQYQALQPNSPYSDFVDLKTGVRSTAAEVFAQMYAGEHHLTFQTCIMRDGNWTWGRLFVVAVPLG